MIHIPGLSFQSMLPNHDDHPIPFSHPRDKTAQSFPAYSLPPVSVGGTAQTLPRRHTVPRCAIGRRNINEPHQPPLNALASAEHEIKLPTRTNTTSRRIRITFHAFTRPNALGLCVFCSSGCAFRWQSETVQETPCPVSDACYAADMCASLRTPPQLQVVWKALPKFFREDQPG